MPSSWQSFLSPVLYLAFQQFGTSLSQITWLLSLPGGRNICLVPCCALHLLCSLHAVPRQAHMGHWNEKLTLCNRKEICKQPRCACSRNIFSHLLLLQKSLAFVRARAHTLPILYCPLCYNDCVRLKAPEGRVLVYGMLSKASCMPGCCFNDQGKATSQHTTLLHWTGIWSLHCKVRASESLLGGRF